MQNKILVFVIFLATVIFSSCYQDNDRILRKIYSSATEADGTIISLADFTNFDWDNVVLTNPGTLNDEYIEIFGGTVKDYKLKYDLQELIIFRKGDQVAHIIRQNWHPEKYPLVNFFAGRSDFIILDKSEAFFVVEKIYSRSYVNLHLMDSYILRKIYSSGTDADGTIISLADFTNFDWDNVVIVSSGTSNDEYIEIFGGTMKNYKKHIDQGLIAFREGDQVVHEIRLDSYSAASGLPPVAFYIGTNSFIILDKSKAFFVVKNNYKQYVGLHLIDSDNIE